MTSTPSPPLSSATPLLFTSPILRLRRNQRDSDLSNTDSLRRQMSQLTRLGDENLRSNPFQAAVASLNLGGHPAQTFNDLGILPNTLSALITDTQELKKESIKRQLAQLNQRLKSLKNQAEKMASHQLAIDEETNDVLNELCNKFDALNKIELDDFPNKINILSSEMTWLDSQLQKIKLLPKTLLQSRQALKLFQDAFELIQSHYQDELVTPIQSLRDFAATFNNLNHYHTLYDQSFNLKRVKNSQINAENYNAFLNNFHERGLALHTQLESLTEELLKDIYTPVVKAGVLPLYLNLYPGLTINYNLAKQKLNQISDIYKDGLGIGVGVGSEGLNFNLPLSRSEFLNQFTEFSKKLDAFNTYLSIFSSIEEVEAQSKSIEFNMFQSLAESKGYDPQKLLNFTKQRHAQFNTIKNILADPFASLINLQAQDANLTQILEQLQQPEAKKICNDLKIINTLILYHPKLNNLCEKIKSYNLKYPHQFKAYMQPNGEFLEQLDAYQQFFMKLKNIFINLGKEAANPLLNDFFQLKQAFDIHVTALQNSLEQFAELKAKKTSKASQLTRCFR